MLRLLVLWLCLTVACGGDDESAGDGGPHGGDGDGDGMQAAGDGDGDSTGLGTGEADDGGVDGPGGPIGPGGPGTEPDGPADPDRRAEILCAVDSVDTPLTADAMSMPGIFDVGRHSELLVDTSRPTKMNGAFAGTPERTFNTQYWYPVAPGTIPPLGLPPPISEEGFFPLVIYNHGFMSSSGEAEALGAHLASHGYFVAALTFPLSHTLAAGGATLEDIENQPGDVSFLIDTVLGYGDTADHLFQNAVDDKRIGVTGVSMGGLTTALATYHRDLHDPRIVAAFPIAGPASMLSRTFYSFRDVPMAALHGDIDALVTYEYNGRRVAERADEVANLITVETGSHAGFALPEGLAGLPPPAGGNPNNPDGFACQFVGANIPMDGKFLEPLGGEEVGVVETDEPEPCEMKWLEMDAMLPADQGRITRMAALSFFGAYLEKKQEDRDANCQFLRKVLPEEPLVRFE